eukprot:SAG11_NODE_3605_length_2344_cov_1.748775_2_plen_96_part_00
MNRCPGCPASKSLSTASAHSNHLFVSMVFEDNLKPVPFNSRNQVQNIFETAGADVTAVAAHEAGSKVAERRMLVSRGALEAVQQLHVRDDDIMHV